MNSTCIDVLSQPNNNHKPNNKTTIPENYPTGPEKPQNDPKSKISKSQKTKKSYKTKVISLNE